MSQHHLFILFGLSLWVQHPGIKLSVRLWVHTKKRSLLHIRRVSDEHLSSYGFACITANFHCHRLPKVSFTETKSIWSTVWRMLWKRGSSCPNSPSQSLNDGSCSKNKTGAVAPAYTWEELWEVYPVFIPSEQAKFPNLAISCLNVWLGKTQTVMCAQNNH